MKTAFVFAGQSAQKPKMGQEFFNLHPTAYPELEDLILNGTLEQLNQTNNTQKAIALTSMVITKEVLKTIQPDVVYGLSLGEYSALWASGVLSDTDFLEIVEMRGNLMHQVLSQTDSSMMAVLFDDSQLIRQLCDKHGCWVSNLNAPNQIVVCGLTQKLEHLNAKMKENKIRTIPLKVSGAFHSPLLEDASKTLNEFLRTKTFSPQQIPVLFNVTGTTLCDEEVIEGLTKQLYSTVDFVSCTKNAYRMGVRRFIEIGPGTTNASLIKKIVDHCDVISINTLQDLEKII